MYIIAILLLLGTVVFFLFFAHSLDYVRTNDINSLLKKPNNDQSCRCHLKGHNFHSLLRFGVAP